MLEQCVFADVGISVDTAVDVAKESADVILLKRFNGFGKRDFIWTARVYEHDEVRQINSKF